VSTLVGAQAAGRRARIVLGTDQGGRRMSLLAQGFIRPVPQSLGNAFGVGKEQPIAINDADVNADLIMEV
jgi:hypothetical protein